MATSKVEFIELADELINDEFADFRVSMNISKGGSYNPSTGDESPGESYDMLAIPLDIESASTIFENVTNSNLYVVAYKGDTTPSTLDASYTCVYDGKEMSIDAVENDPAGAAWFFSMVK